MTAACMGGVIASTAPGAKVTTPPFSDAFTRANGNPGQPWFNPRCDVPTLGIVSDTLQSADDNYPRNRAGLLLDSTDLDVTFTVHFSALVAGVRDDMQFWFRANTCTPPDDGLPCDAFGVTMQPNSTSAVGGHGVSIYRQDPSGFTELVTRDYGLINEGDTHTLRVHVYGDVCDVYLDDLTVVYLSQAVSDLNGQTACYFVAGKTSSYFDDISFVAPVSPLWSDSFDRVDSTSSPGTGWTADAGTWGIATDRLYCSAGVTAGALVHDIGVSDNYAIEVDISITTGSDMGVWFRYSDHNNAMLLALNPLASVTLFRVIAGVGTSIGTGAAPLDGDHYQISVVGSAITVKRLRGGVVTTQVTASDSTWNTNTKVGARSQSDTVSRWDNYRVFAV